MNFKFILWLLLMIINHALGEFLQMSLANVNTSMILMRISGITVTACHMECAKQSLCHSIAITERSSNKLPDCLLLKEDNGFHGTGNEMTTIRTIGYGVKVNGQWGCWRSISACTVSCGGGSVNQTRDCDSPRPAHGGDNCTGPANRTVKCNEHNCPVNGQWGIWRNSSACNVSCGGGVLNQSRDCDSPRPAHGGDECTGPANRSVKCNEQVCPVHGHWGNWRDTSACTFTCGEGTLDQSRDCNTPKPEHGGDNCTGPANRAVKCNEQTCPRILTKFFNPRNTLENGRRVIYGYIAIYREGEWGTICDDGFGKEEAKVLCRMAGYNGGVFYDGVHYNVGDGKINGISRTHLKIWIDELKCNGNEATLYHCRHAGWGISNCGHHEDVGIKCYE